MSADYGQSKSSSSSNSNPLTANEVASYYAKLNSLSGGRLNDFATNGTPQLTTEQIQAVGGMGADQQRQLDVARKQAVDQVTADPNLTIDQRQRSTQLTNQDYNDRLAAITKQIEAQKTNLAQNNAGLASSDLATLANIYFGGKGQRSSSGSMSRESHGGGGIK